MAGWSRQILVPGSVADLSCDEALPLRTISGRLIAFGIHALHSTAFLCVEWTSDRQSRPVEDVRVDHRRRDIGVARQLLNRPDRHQLTVAIRNRE